MLFFLIRSKVFMSLYKIPQWLVSNHQNPSAATLKFTFSEMYGSSILVEESLIYSFPSPIFNVGVWINCYTGIPQFSPSALCLNTRHFTEGLHDLIDFFFKLSYIQKKYYCKRILIKENIYLGKTMSLKQICEYSKPK